MQDKFKHFDTMKARYDERVAVIAAELNTAEAELQQLEHGKEKALSDFMTDTDVTELGDKIEAAEKRIATINERLTYARAGRTAQLVELIEGVSRYREKLATDKKGEAEQAVDELNRLKVAYLKQIQRIEALTQEIDGVHHRENHCRHAAGLPTVRYFGYSTGLNAPDVTETDAHVGFDKAAKRNVTIGAWLVKAAQAGKLPRWDGDNHE